MINVNDSELNDITNYIENFRSTRLETLTRTSKLSNTFDTLERHKKFQEIKEILEITASYHINVLEYEMKEGLRILIKAKLFDDVLEIFHLLLSHKKILDEHIVILIITACFSSNDAKIINKSFKSIITYYSLNKNVSHSFWQSSIDGLIKTKYYEQANVLIKMYPIKYSYSESLWKKIIISNILENFVEIFNLFIDKYESRALNDDCRGFENIFNIFVEEVTNYFDKIQVGKIKIFFDILIKHKITVREAPLEKFLTKIVHSNRNDFYKVEEYLTKCDCLLTKRIIEKILEEYSKLNDYFAVFAILNLSKSKKIPVPYQSLNIPSKCLKELIKFIIDRSELKFEESFFTTLSENNQSYILKNFNQSESSLSEKSHCEEGKIITIKGELELTLNSLNFEKESNTSELIKEKKEICQNNEIDFKIEEGIKFENDKNIKEPENIPNLEEVKIEDDFLIY